MQTRTGRSECYVTISQPDSQAIRFAQESDDDEQRFGEALTSVAGPGQPNRDQAGSGASQPVRAEKTRPADLHRHPALHRHPPAGPRRWGRLSVLYWCANTGSGNLPPLSGRTTFIRKTVPSRTVTGRSGKTETESAAGS